MTNPTEVVPPAPAPEEKKTRKKYTEYFTVVIQVKSVTGAAPDCRVICGDMIAVNLFEGMEASYKIVKGKIDTD